MVSRAAHALNYEREKAHEKQTFTVDQLYERLGELRSQGYGHRPILRMETGRKVDGELDGLTHSHPVVDIFAAQPYDGEIVWMLT